MVKKEDKIAYEIEIERSEEMEQEIDNSINQMNDEFTSFGVDAVLECICENEKLKHQNKK